MSKPLKRTTKSPDDFWNVRCPNTFLICTGFCASFAYLKCTVHMDRKAQKTQRNKTCRCSVADRCINVCTEYMHDKQSLGEKIVLALLTCRNQI